ncbi:cytochrome c [Aureimonas mangrovi]|uniref:cytochrome c n=1 Tax=Aureimonas mangrovi TaxID=2758041 RepID=UPI00163D5828|nr:cytochrome c [Aureimonas mangrovi]
MRRAVAIGASVVVVAAGAVWALALPQRLPPEAVAAEGSGDARRGRVVFNAGGCASCHMSGGDAEAPELGGGEALETAVGTFHGPNISPHETDGIGAWSLADFANAMQRGVAPGGQHLYPAFPYTSYARMTPGDVADLHAFLLTLPPVEGRAPQNEIAFPFDLRFGLGLWKRAFLSDAPVVDLPSDASAQLQRGRYLVEGPAHCGECHTPRTLGGYGGLDTARWLGGGPNPEGEGTVPNITPGGLDWSESDIAYYLESGFTPDFDVAGGAMADVIDNMALLAAEDREAIAAYLRAVPAVE